MKKTILFYLLPLIVFSLLALSANAIPAIQQEVKGMEDEIALLKKANASLQTQLAKQRITLSKQIQQSDSNIAILKATVVKEQGNINDLRTTLSKQQAELDEVPAAIAARSYLFGQKRILAVSLIIISFIMVIIYVLNLKKKVAAFMDELKRAEERLAQKFMQANDQNKAYLVQEINELKEMLEKQTHENKNRIVALLADTNQMVHNMGDRVSKDYQGKIATLKNEHDASIKELNARLDHFNPNKSL